MKEDKAYLVRKVFTVITLILLFATLGLILIRFNVKTVNLNYYGNTKSVKTLATTVQSFLLQNDIAISENTAVTPSLNSKLTNGIEIKLDYKNQLSKINIDQLKNGYKPTIAKIEETTDTIPFDDQTKENSSINKGETHILQEGKEGTKVTRYIAKYNGENETYRAQLDTEVAVEPQNKITEIGTKIASRSAVINLPSTIDTDDGFKQYNIALPVDQQKYTYNMCEKYGVQYELMLAVMYKESHFNPTASSGIADGLCQINRNNLSMLSRNLGTSNLFNPYQNIEAGVYMLARCFTSAKNVTSDSTDTLVYALNSYNMGAGAYYNTCSVDDDGSLNVYDRAYSNSVISYRNKLLANGTI